MDAVPGYVCRRNDRNYALTEATIVCVNDYSAVPFKYLTIVCPCGIFHTLPQNYAVDWAEEAGYQTTQYEGWPPPDIECLDEVEKLIVADWSEQLYNAPLNDIYAELEGQQN